MTLRSWKMTFISLGYRQHGFMVQLPTKSHFQKLDQTCQLSTKFFKYFNIFSKFLKKLGTVRAKFVYEIDSTLCGAHSQVNL